jgi:hypothetical protein
MFVYDSIWLNGYPCPLFSKRKKTYPALFCPLMWFVSRCDFCFERLEKEWRCNFHSAVAVRRLGRPQGHWACKASVVAKAQWWPCLVQVTRGKTCCCRKSCRSCGCCTNHGCTTSQTAVIGILGGRTDLKWFISCRAAPKSSLPQGPFRRRKVLHPWADNNLLPRRATTMLFDADKNHWLDGIGRAQRLESLVWHHVTSIDN